VQLDFVSPTRLTKLRQCQYRVALDLGSPGGGPSENAAAALGRAVHLALQDLVDTGRIRDSGPLDDACRDAWARAIDVVYAEPPIPRLIPSYYLKQARLPNVASRLRDLLHPYGTLESEVPLASTDGLLRGTADLIATNGQGVLLLDYKSGVDRDPGTGHPRVDDYARQLQFYAFLLSEMRGSRPRLAAILPMDGPPIPVDISEDACVATVLDARALLREFNSGGELHPASPSPTACHYCPHLVRCIPFRDACDVTWSPEMLAVVGTVIASEEAADGSVSVAVQPTAGSVGKQRISLARLSTLAFPALTFAIPGVEISVSGLFSIGPPGEVYGVRETGTFDVLSRDRR
jgi:RecB family exonuclease